MSQLALSLWPESELAEPFLYHDPSRSGFVSLVTPSGKRRQRAFRVSELPLMLASVDGQLLDTYLSQHEFFKPNRRLVNCKRLTSLYIDLDGYKGAPHQARAAEGQLDSLLARCELEKIPPPTVVVHSGRGLQAKWVLEKPVPPAAVVRWKAVQEHLCGLLEPLGADPKALDVSRALRLVGTVNTKNGVVAREVYRARAPTMGAVRLPSGVIAYPFDGFADTVLPIPRSELERERLARSALADGELLHRDVSRVCPEAPAASEFHWFSPEEWARRRYTQLVPERLAWDRLCDLRLLLQVRAWHAGVPEGFRDTFLFLAGCFLAWTNLTRDLKGEMWELATEFVPNLSLPEVDSCLGAVYARWKAAAAGEKVSYHGIEVDPRYRFTNSYLVEKLELTPDEQVQMKTIVSKEESRRRNTTRHSERRREQGCLTRDEYRAQAANKKAIARQMNCDGTPLSEIAVALGVSKSAVRGYCKGG